MLRKLPLDRSTFDVLRRLNYLYVDKTEHAYNLITGGHRFFLSRPRRFFKSLFVSTLKEILDGNKKLFHDLWIGKSDYRWEKHGVIALDFSKIDISEGAAEKFNFKIIEQLNGVANDHKVFLI